MKVILAELPDAPPGQHPLLSQAQYAAQLAGSSLFFQVMSRIDENPVKVILHDRNSGKKQLLTIETSREVTPIPPPATVHADVRAPKETKGPQIVKLAEGAFIPPAPTAPSVAPKLSMSTLSTSAPKLSISAPMNSGPKLLNTTPKTLDATPKTLPTTPKLTLRKP